MESSHLDQDFPLIEQDPEGFCDQFDADAIEEYLNRAADIYYNGNDPEQLCLSDYAYDCLVYWITKMRKKTLTTQARIGALPRVKNCVKLPYLMPSLNKVKIGGSLETFLQNESITYSLKLDGISALVTYNNGTPAHCYLRGNGIYGSDVTYVLDHITLPEVSNYPSLVVRGELIVSKTFWNKTFGCKSKATARNWVSGLMNSDFVSPYLRHIDFVAYEIISLDDTGRVPRPIKGLTILKDEGFKVVRHGSLVDKLSANVLLMYKRYTESYEYVIDGIVLAINQPKTRPTELKNPVDCVAFKVNLQDQIRETVVTNIAWNYTRHGRLVPVAEFRPVFIDGAKVRKAFVYNAMTCIRKYQLGIGTRITVTRSGGVIPMIVEVLEVIGKPCVPQIPYEWHWERCDIVLDNPDECHEVMLQQHVHFFETLNIPNIREGMLKRIHQNGLISLNDIIMCSKEKLRKVPGIGPKRSEQYFRDIRTGLAKAHLYRVMLASGCFPNGIGKSILRQITKACPDILQKCRMSSLLQLPGIGQVRATKIKEGLETFKEFVSDFPIELDQVSVQQESSMFNKKRFVFTNLEDDQLEDFILDNGGKISVGVDTKTSGVISGNIMVITEKMLTAHELGIKIYTVSEFTQKYGYKQI
jgi:DNA ligase (NAD+)